MSFTALYSYGSHIFGVDLYYTHIAGNTYKISLVIYGDCSGAAFPSLSSATPVVDIYNGNTYESDVTLSLQAPTSGVEVTPVCSADAGSTTCSVTGSTIPGIKKFVYTGNVTVSTTSSVWRFLFKGDMGTGASAGRSNSITNITIPAATGSLIQVVDTLNNTTYDNSSAIYNTIPTPFFCINVPANFNPAAVDPDGDSLVFNLVPAIDGNTGSSVTYISPYTATAPLATTAGTFSFNSATGQLSFTPNATQKSLVVYNVEEYHLGVLRGTTQREMAVVVISPCSNNPPTGAITTPTAGTLADTTTLDICSSTGTFSFHLDPTDADLDSITMTASGLPSGATFTITSNNTPHPLGTFSWSTTGITPGNYTFFVTYKDNGCPLSSTQTLAYTITVYPTPTQAYTQTAAATCTKKGIFQVVPSGSPGPYTIKILEGATVVQTLTGITGTLTDSLSPGTYTIYTYNPDNCYVDTTITIASPILPAVTASTAAPLCPGGATGTATIAASLGLAPYQYAIGAGAYGSSGTFSGLAAGAYTLSVKDANGCIRDTVITVPAATPLLMHISIQKPLCNNFADGSVTITGYNSVAPYTYAIGAGAYNTANTFTALAAGTYTFEVKNANNCIVDTILTLADSENIHATLIIAPIQCNGGDATVTVNATGGYGPPYTYANGSGSFGSSGVFTVPVGSYTFHVLDPQSCFFDTSITLTQPAPVAITPTLTNVSCYGGASGGLLVTASGGTPAYMYGINGGALVTSDLFTGLVAGAQDIEVEDANGCIYTDTVTLTQPAPIVINSVAASIPSCYAGANGTFTVTVSGGTPGYTYAYNTSAYSAANVITGLSAGTYTVYVQDANGCIKDTVLTLSQPPAIVPSAIIKSPVCSTLANGRAMIAATGGTPGYTYAVGGGAYTGSGTFSPLAAGAYTFDIKDANGCIVDTVITLADSLHVSGTFSITPALCFDSASGTIVVHGTGGAAPYTYAFGAAIYSGTNTFTALVAGAYSFDIKDANGCITDTSVSVTQPAAITPALTITQPSCYGSVNGSVTISASGGTPAFTYSFDGGTFSGTTTYTSLPAGSGSIAIKDANGCIHDTAFTIAQPSRLFFGSISFTNISCNGGADGSVTVTGAGASAPYQYAANTGTYQTSPMLTGLAAGTQIIHVMDSHGCTIDTSITLTQPAALVFTGADTVNPTCQGYRNGSVALLVAGGTTPYSYSMDNITFYSTNAFDSLAEGTYTFYIRDSNNCSNDTTITLTGLPHILIDNVSITPPACYGAENGAVTLTVSGGVDPLSFRLGTTGTPNTTGTFDSLASGPYTIIVTDSRDCKKDTSVMVPAVLALSIATAVTPNTCVGYDTRGGAEAAIQGGTPPYTYLWSTSPAQTTAGVSDLGNGSYTVWVKDANNCTDSATVLVTYDDCCTPFIPDAFTPNGDGNNDIFRIRFKGDMSIVVFSVYNRFGQVVYSISNTSDTNQGWDGKFNGIPVDIGTYFYYAKIICGNKGDHTVELKGDVTVIR
jgi:gliding motility-associated-like protein